MSERVDFSATAAIYDRRHGAAVSSEGLDRLCEAAGVQPGDRVLDVGAGTGRIAIPLARRGYTVVAVEPAGGMLDALRVKDAGRNVRAVAAEGAHLPFPGDCFHVVVAARLLYLTRDWRGILREATRVLAAGGRLLHEWGNGQADEEWVQIREETRRRFESAGLTDPFHPGARSDAEIDACLQALRLSRDHPIDLGPGPMTTVREFLGRLVEGELSYTWHVPDTVRAACLPGVQRWADERFDLDRPVPMPRAIRWTIFRK